MSGHDIEEWEKETAEVEIRQWLYRTGQWAPEAAQAVVEEAHEPHIIESEAHSIPVEVVPTPTAETPTPPPEPVESLPPHWYQRFWRWLRNESG